MSDQLVRKLKVVVPVSTGLKANRLIQSVNVDGWLLELGNGSKDIQDVCKIV